MKKIILIGVGVLLVIAFGMIVIGIIQGQQTSKPPSNQVTLTHPVSDEVAFFDTIDPDTAQVITTKPVGTKCTKSGNEIDVEGMFKLQRLTCGDTSGYVNTKYFK